MARIGFTLSSEEHGPGDLLLYGRLAEEAGFDFLTIPITSTPGPRVRGTASRGACWRQSVKTEHVPIVTGVTCPTIRIHPAIVAQAAATTACLLPDRFVLGVGTGEHLNEHVLGDAWPHPERLAMLEEAIELMRMLWTGDLTTEWTAHYVVDRARLYDVPETPPPVAVAAATPATPAFAGRAGDALIRHRARPRRSVPRGGGEGKPVYGQLGRSAGVPELEKAKDEALEWWPNTSVPGSSWSSPSPSTSSPSPSRSQRIRWPRRSSAGRTPARSHPRSEDFVDAGFDHVPHQVGPRQEEFFSFAKDELLDAVRERTA